MKVFIVKNYNEMSEKACEIIINQVLKKPNSVLGFATGKTPLGLYKLLVKACRQREIDFSKVKSFNLDEYYPISKKNKKSYFYYMHKNLFDKINMKKENINLLNGEARDWKKECKDYENKIKKNKIDVQILGIGRNGHIGFNEPGSEKDSKTRLVELTHVKGEALTMGIGTIIKARNIILLASGKEKAEAIKCMIKGRINKDCPASFLRKHRNLIVIVDKEAGKLIN